MIGELDVGYFKAVHLDLGAVQDEIQLLARAAARIGRQTMEIVAVQSGRLGEQVELVIAPVGIEIAGHDYGLTSFTQQIIEISQLILTMPEFQGQVHQKNRDIVEFQLDDQALDAGVEIVKALAADPRCRKEGI